MQLELLHGLIALHAAAGVAFAIVLFVTATTSIRKPSFARQVLALLALWPVGLCANALAPEIRKLAVEMVNATLEKSVLTVPVADSVNLLWVMYALSIFAVLVRIAAFAFFSYRIPKGAMNKWRDRERTFGISLGLSAYGFTYIIVVLVSFELAGTVVALPLGGIALVIIAMLLTRLDASATRRRAQPNF